MPACHPDSYRDAFESRLPRFLGTNNNKEKLIASLFFMPFMNHFVYIIYAEKFDKYYKGYTTNPENRLKQHNNKESRYTAYFTPWILMYLQKFDTKKEALIREKALKKFSKKSLINLIKSPKNILNN